MRRLFKRTFSETKKRKTPVKPAKKLTNNNGLITTEAGLSIPTKGKLKDKKYFSIHFFTSEIPWIFSNSRDTLTRSGTTESQRNSSLSSSDLNSLSLNSYSMNFSSTNNNELLSRTQRLLIENSWKRSRKVRISFYFNSITTMAVSSAPKQTHIPLTYKNLKSVISEWCR